MQWVGDTGHQKHDFLDSIALLENSVVGLFGRAIPWHRGSTVSLPPPREALHLFMMERLPRNLEEQCRGF
jgi:hypothetical protein